MKRFLAQEGEARPVLYDAAKQRLSIGDGRALTHFVSLRSLKARYDAIEEPKSRVRVLERDLIAMRWTKPTIEVLARRLFPRLRPRAALQTLELKRKVLEHVQGQSAADLSVASRDLNSLFSVQLVFQLSEEAVDVGTDRLGTWGRSFDELLKLAFENLLQVSTDPVREVRPNLWAVTGGGGHIAARLLFDDVVEKLPFRDEVVAMAPNQNVVLFAKKSDDEALERMAGIGLDASQAAFGLWGVTMHRENGRWESWMPDSSRPSYAALKTAALPGTVRLYQAHKEILAAWLEIQRMPTEVSPLLAIQDDESVYSSAVWQHGVPTLLPPADRIAVVETSSGEPSAWSVPWGEIEALGAKLERAEGELEYWRVTGTLPMELVQKYPQVQ
ncbi:MAG: hypothetical protein IPJ65_28485 [Archangiaceae bacterium]|nr:hypothetical protein [Archangiaceae bacterium]